MAKADRSDRKTAYFQKINLLLDEYDKLFIVNADNVGSNQMQQIRISLRGKAVVLMGKNTMMRKAIRAKLDAKPQLERLLPFVVQNVGFVFTNCDLAEVRDLINANKVAAPAKAGALAPIDVHLQAMTTTLGPEKTSFFQALSIPTKITRGNIELLSGVHLIVEGEKVGASEATLLGMLGIMPFHYGLAIERIYDNGSIYTPNILDITSENILASFATGIQKVAAISLAIGHPTVVSVPHSLINGYKTVLKVCLAMEDYVFPMAAELKELLSDPEKLAAAAAAAASSAPAASSGGGAAEKKEEAKEESESDDDMGFGLFD